MKETFGYVSYETETPIPPSDTISTCLSIDYVGARKRKIFVMSVCTDQSPLLENWKMSLEKFGYSYAVLGLGEKWGGWKWRTQKYIEAVSRLQTECLVVLTDATDVFFVAPPDQLLKSFLSYDSDVVVGAEHQCCTSWVRWNFNVKEAVLQFARKKNPHTRYIVPNGGFIMGYRTPLINALCGNLDQEDDQHGYLVNWLEHPDEPFKLDIFARCVANIVYDIALFDTEDDERVELDYYKVRNGSVYSTEREGGPCVMHFPGGNAEGYNYFGEKLFDDRFSPMSPKKATVTDTIKKSWTMPIKEKLSPFLSGSSGQRSTKFKPKR